MKFMNIMKLRKDEKGFTLIELMIVVAIIGILAAVAIPNFISYRDKAYCSQAESDANALAGAVSDFYAIPAHTTWVNTDVATLPATVSIATTVTGGGSITWPSLSGTNTASVNGPVSGISITVNDGSTRCPLDYRTAQAAAGWTTGAAGTFTKTMQ